MRRAEAVEYILHPLAVRDGERMVSVKSRRSDSGSATTNIAL